MISNKMIESFFKRFPFPREMSLVNESVRITNEINLCIFYRRMIFEIEYFADCFFGLIRFLLLCWF
ncbi:hypothetical protein LEP1GSC005_2233 [Leptospira santarosai str. ST188]|nr:hypothetical protein LEP1GSC005_2233 [Leptospira santarosai str. ST188]EMO99360.1 hypothetical protein LEP1GSC120_2364 [Leptospira santarosai str. 200702252]